ncbi:MAG: hypothetical protein HC915_20290 [Anaerolineae bacterium]|nr:hypothetical protein [Anaerolineae bacterium]
MWSPPQVTVQQVTRTAFGFDKGNQIINDVSGRALRAIHEAMLLTLRETQPDLSFEALQRATQVWLEALNQTVPGAAPFSVAGIKGMAQSYSVEFYFLADSYARQICQNETRYLENLVKEIIPPTLIQASHAVRLSHLIKSNRMMF